MCMTSQIKELTHGCNWHKTLISIVKYIKLIKNELAKIKSNFGSHGIFTIE